MQKGFAMNENELLNASVELGSRLLECGGEVYRVEESVQRILDAYGVQGAEVFAIQSCIIVSFLSQEGKSLSRMRRVHPATINLELVDRYNDLSRRICRDTPEISVILQELERVASTRTYGLAIQIFAYALISFSFTLFWGGTLADALCSILGGAAIKLVLWQMGRFQTNSFFTNIVATAAAAFLALLTVRLGWAVHSDKMIIGMLMNLVPGVAITNVMRDVIAGDILCGLTKMTDSLLVATAMALGAGLAISIFRFLWGV